MYEPFIEDTCSDLPCSKDNFKPAELLFTTLSGPRSQLVRSGPIKLQFPCAYADEKVIAGSGEDREGFEWDG